jgi:telomerase reverse transcriptase
VTQPPAKPSPSTRLPDTQHHAPEAAVTEEKTETTGRSKRKVNLTDYATPASAVSAFCRAVILKIVPARFFGEGPEGFANRKIIMKHVDSFIKMRRFESLSLHEVCSGLKVRSIFQGLIKYGDL